MGPARSCRRSSRCGPACGRSPSPSPTIRCATCSSTPSSSTAAAWPWSTPAGTPTRPGRRSSDGLATAGGSISDVRAVLVTHIHPDHYGLAGRVREASGAWIGLHPADAVMLESRYGDTDELVAAMFRFLAESGVPDDKLPDLAARLDGRQVDGDHGRARRPVRGRQGHRSSRMAPAHHLDPRALARPRLLLQRRAPSCSSPATTSCPASPPTSRSTPSRSPTRWATILDSLPQGPGPRDRGGPPGPRVPVLRPPEPARGDHRPPRRPPGGDRAGPHRPSRLDGLGDHPPAPLVAALGRDPVVHAAAGQRGDRWPTASSSSCDDRIRREGTEPARFFLAEP